MKIRPTFSRFDMSVGFRWDRHRRILFFFLLPMLGIRLEFKNAIVTKALPPVASHDDILLTAIARYPSATWQELKLQLGGMGATNATLARERLLKDGKIHQVSIEVVDQQGIKQKRRVLQVC